MVISHYILTAYLADENVLRLEISVEDVVSVTVGQATQQLEVERLGRGGSEGVKWMLDDVTLCYIPALSLG